MPALHKVLSKLFRDRYLAVFQICLGFWLCHGSNYARVTQGCEFFIIGIWQGSEYASSSASNIPVLQGSVGYSSSYMFEYSLSSQYVRA